MTSEAMRATALLSMLEEALGDAIATTSAAEAPEPQALPPFEAKVVADALDVIDRDRTKPSRDEVRIYLRPGRRYLRVFWTDASAPDDSGSILHFVERATGKVFAAKSSKRVGYDTGRVIRVVASEAQKKRLAEVLRDSEVLTPQRVIGLLRMPTARWSTRKDETRSGVEVRKQTARSVSVEWSDRASEGEAARRAHFDEVLSRLERAGYGFHLLSGELGEDAIAEARVRGVVLVHLPKGAAPAQSQPRSERRRSGVTSTAQAPKAKKNEERERSEPTREETWEPHRVVWFRPIDAGESSRRVELRLGDTAWVSFGKEGKGSWASVNGLSKTRRELKMGTQWVGLPFVYTRDEVPADVAAAVPEGEQPGTPFAALLEGLRTRKVRKLRIVSTDASPHDMRVARVLSQPGSVVAEGTVKRSKAKLTIATDVDARGRPTKYARLRKGSREYRVDARRITAPALERASEAPAPTPSASPSPARVETARQRQRRERAERRAERLGRVAEAQHADARAELAHIPPGQPVLVGHHSERRHRKAIERSSRKARQALDTSRAAEAARSTAARAGYAISSDDPNALPALEARLSALEEQRAFHNAMNAAYRKGGWAAVEQVPGMTPEVLASAKRTLELAPWLKKPAETKNLGANIRRVRRRIEELRAAAEQPAGAPIEGEGFTIEEDPDDNRVRFRFDERPDKETLAEMKRAGFRWSRRHGAWQRQLNSAGRQAARRMAHDLFGWTPPEDERAPYPPHVLAEAAETGRTPEQIVELYEQSAREEAEMGRKLREAARSEEAALAAGRAGEEKSRPARDIALEQLAEGETE